MLEGTPLQELAPSEDDDDEDTGITPEVNGEERDGVMIDDVPLAALGTTESGWTGKRKLGRALYSTDNPRQTTGRRNTTARNSQSSTSLLDA